MREKRFNDVFNVIARVSQKHGMDTYAAYAELSRDLKRVYYEKGHSDDEKQIVREAYNRFASIVVQEAMEEHGYECLDGWIWKKKEE